MPLLLEQPPAFYRLVAHTRVLTRFSASQKKTTKLASGLTRQNGMFSTVNTSILDVGHRKTHAIEFYFIRFCTHFASFLFLVRILL